MMFDICIVKGPRADAVYCGRPSPLGNPFRMLSESDRDRVCDEYDVWFHENVDNLKPVLRELWHKGVRDGSLLLSCWCAPKRCHLETVKAFLESQSVPDSAHVG